MIQKQHNNIFTIIRIPYITRVPEISEEFFNSYSTSFYVKIDFPSFLIVD